MTTEADTAVASPLLFTRAQHVTLVLVPVVTGLLSMVGSTAIIRNILSDGSKSIHRDGHLSITRRQQGRAGSSGYLYYRLLLALSVADLVSTGCVVVFSPWASPRGTAGFDFGAWGTTATCNVLGMALHLNQVTGLYAAFLSFYFLLVIRFQKSDAWIGKNVDRSRHARGGNRPADGDGPRGVVPALV
jgi:hypothetical protein